MSKLASDDADRDPPSETPRFGSGRGALAIRIAFGLALLGSALAIGSIPSAALCVVAAVLALVCGVAWAGGERFRARRPATIILGVGVGLCAFTALQAVPMPLSWLAAIAPANADVWARALTPLHETGPSSAPITLDPVATHVQVLRGVAYVLTFLVAVRLANRRQGVVFLECAVALSGLVIAVAALLHPAFGVDKVYGIIKHSPSIVPRHVAPLLNANHLAAYIDVAFCVALGSALSPRAEVPRVVSFTVAAVLVGVELWVASRGGVLAMGVGAILVIALTRSTATHKHALTTGIALAVIAGAGIGMAVLSSNDDSWQELASLEDSKSAIFRQAMHMTAAFPVLGAGRGAFQSAFPAFRTAMGYGDVTQPENIIAQWSSEWGAPAAALAAGLLAFALRPKVALARSRPPVGAWTAIVVVALHNLVDFNLETPAVAMAVATCAGMCVAGSADARRRSRLDLWSARPRTVAVLGVVAAALAIAWVAPNLGREDDDDRELLHARSLDPEMDLVRYHELARAAILRHPAEPYLSFAGAVRASRARDESLMPWIERTFDRALVYGPAHFLLARSLVRASPSQARMEYRYAAEQDGGIAHHCVKESLPLINDFDDAMEVVPRGRGGLDVLEMLAEGLAQRLPSTRVRLDEEILARNPRAVQPLERRFQDVIVDVEAGDAAPWCALQHAECVQRGEEIAKRLIEIEPTRCAPYELRARLLSAAGDSKHALDALQQATDRVNDRETCLTALARMAHAAHDDTREGMALEKLEHAGCAKESDCIGEWMDLARLQEGRGEKSHAMALYKRVLERDPDNETALAAEARLAADVGMHAAALAAYVRLSQRHPDDANYARAAAAERAALYMPKQ